MQAGMALGAVSSEGRREPLQCTGFGIDKVLPHLCGEVQS
jgi:hypothetical protein